MYLKLDKIHRKKVGQREEFGVWDGRATNMGIIEQCWWGWGMKEGMGMKVGDMGRRVRARKPAHYVRKSESSKVFKYSFPLHPLTVLHLQHVHAYNTAQAFLGVIRYWWKREGISHGYVCWKVSARHSEEARAHVITTRARAQEILSGSVTWRLRGVSRVGLRLRVFVCVQESYSSPRYLSHRGLRIVLVS